MESKCTEADIGWDGSLSSRPCDQSANKVYISRRRLRAVHLSVFRERRSVPADQEGWLREAIASGLKIEKSRDGFPSLHRDKRQPIADFSQIRPPKRQRGKLVSLPCESVGINYRFKRLIRLGQFLFGCLQYILLFPCRFLGTDFGTQGGTSLVLYTALKCLIFLCHNTSHSVVRYVIIFQ